MNDLENDLRRVLERDAERAPLVTHAPSGMRVRVRRRQVATAFVAGLATAAVIAGATFAISRIPGGPTRPADEEPRGSRTSTVRGITLEYPAGWTLAELTDEVNVNEGPSGPEGTISGRALFELSSFDPMDTGGLNVSCDWGGWSPLPSDGALLYVQTLEFPRVPRSIPPAWPVEPEQPVQGSSGAGASDRSYATWTAGDRVYEGFLCGSPSPALERLREAFASMTFGPEGPDAEAVVAPDGMPVIGPFYVLDSGVAEGQRWNLLAYAGRYPLVPTRICIALEVDGSVLDPQCDLDVAAGELTGEDVLGMEGTGHLVRAGGSEVFYAWGAVSATVDELRPRLDTGTALGLSRVPLPPSFDVGFDAVIAIGSPDVSGEVRALVDGEVRGYFPFIADAEVEIELPDGRGSG